MKRFINMTIILIFTQFTQATVIKYSFNNLDSGNFEYVYTITNDTLTVPIEQLTIWFDQQFYNNLQIVFQPHLANDFDEIILPATGLGVPLGYDVLAISGGINIGQSVSGFSIRFNWLGDGLPGTQHYEIIVPATNHTIDSGFTIPEPATLLLLSLSFVINKGVRE
ncbi:MAG: hypothetical protein ABFD79_03265 [Phycisphaerales bacterium]